MITTLTKEKAIEIIKAYENGKHDLFNWCEEYKQFVNNGVCMCLSYEVDYILKKSWEDDEAPFKAEELDLFDIDKARKSLVYDFENHEEEYKGFANDENRYNRRVKNKSDWEVFLNSLDRTDIEDALNLFLDRTDAEGEVFEWWALNDDFAYWLKQEGEIFIADSNIWGRQTTGQAISLDGCCMHAFINMLKARWTNV